MLRGEETDMQEGAVQAKNTSHTVTMNGRKNIVVTGINEVTSYDSNTIVANSDVGELIIQGKLLHIESFDRISGRLTVDGALDAVQYVDVRQKSDSFLSRLLK
jgi:sporulation protein YabP